MGRPTAGWGSINCAGAGQPGRVWQARTAPGVAMLPGEAGINVRKTARYASKDCDPLHVAGNTLLWISAREHFALACRIQASMYLLVNRKPGKPFSRRQIGRAHV